MFPFEVIIKNALKLVYDILKTLILIFQYRTHLSVLRLRMDSAFFFELRYYNEGTKAFKVTDTHNI